MANLNSTEQNVVLRLYMAANASGKLGEILCQEGESTIQTLNAMKNLLEEVAPVEMVNAFEDMVYGSIMEMKGGW